MSPEIILLVMLITFAVSVFALRLPSGVSLMIAAILGGFAGGHFFPVRHLAEGAFGFLEAIMIIASAMIFMKVVNASGALGTISYGIIKMFYRSPLVLMIVLCLFVMFPGMLTGLSSACILTTGALIIPALLAMGIEKKAAGSFIAIAAVLGEIAPPISIPVMIIGGGVDMPYIGFNGPLLVASMPAALLTSVYFRYRYLGQFDINEVLNKLDKPVYAEYRIKLFIPVIFILVWLTGEQVFTQYFPHLGVPLIFIIGALLGFGTGRKFNILKLAEEAIKDALPVMSILVGVGMFLQILTLTGVRGDLAVKALYMPEEVKYLAALVMPFFGSAYAAASVIGVPLVFVFLGKNSIVVVSALALLAAMGDMMPPPSLLCAYAGQMVKESNHFRILKKSLPLLILIGIFGLLMIYFANDINSFLKIIG